MTPFYLVLMFCTIATYTQASGANNSFHKITDLTHDTVQQANSIIDRISNFPAKVLKRTNNKIASIQRSLEKQSKKYITKLLKQESKLGRKFSAIDSAASKNAFPESTEKEYTSLFGKLKSDTVVAVPKNISGEYYPYMDSLQIALSYLSKNPQLIDVSKIPPGKITATLKNLMVLQSKMHDADQIKQFLQQRKEQIKQYLKQYTNLSPAIGKAYRNYNEKLYYYAAQVQEYREVLNDPGKLTKLALQVLNKVPAFKSFAEKNSMLAGIFNLSGSYTPSAPGQGLPGRDQVLAAFQNRSMASGSMTSNTPDLSSVVQKNVQSATTVVDNLRNKLSAYGSSNAADADLPKFKPNAQKTKSFLKRLEIGTDLQTLKSNFYFPASTDIGISLGYKIDSKNVVGIGGSIKVGWGKNISHVKITGEGASIRSFVDINLKKSLYASGGFEYNYQEPFNPLHFARLKDWTQSGLLGLTKKIALHSKLVKSMKVQVLWDFLSYQQIPIGPPLKFRVGYNF